MSDPGFFEILENTRAIKRLRPDPVPLQLIRRVLDAGTKAPSGVDTQPWEFLVVRDRETKRWIQQRYLHFTTQRFGNEVDSLAEADSPHARMLRTVMHLAKHLHEVPVLLFVCGHRDWPAAVPPIERVGPAPPPYGSIYPCAQNILLACRAVGLGASLTTVHHMFEHELAARLGVPDAVSLVALLPIGFPRGRFGPVTRKPAPEVTHFDGWGNPDTNPERFVYLESKSRGVDVERHRPGKADVAGFLANRAAQALRRPVQLTESTPSRSYDPQT